LTKSVIALLFAILLIVSLVIFGNQFVLIVQESIETGVPFQELMPLISYNMIRDFPVIFSLSFFLAIILTITQLSKNSEVIVMNSVGLSDRSFITFLQPLVFLAFLFIFYLATAAVPWSKHQKNIIEEENKNASEFSFIKEGEFEEFKQGEIVFYASDSSTPDSSLEQHMEEIFISATSKDMPIIVLASEAIKFTDSETSSIYLRLRDGTRYQGLPGSENNSILDFDQYDLQIVSGDIQKNISNFTDVEGKKTFDLIRMRGSLASAELQWRLSQPIGLVILSILGVLLGKSSPRRGKSVGLLIGIVVFMLYNNGLLIAKNSIERDELNPIIGLWSVHILFFIITYIFYLIRNGKFSGYLDKI